MENMYIFLAVICITAVTSRHVAQRQLAPHCDTICNEEMVDKLASVCGSDGILYKSKCDYNNALCKARMNGTNLLFASIGPECVTDSTTCDVLAKTQCIRLPPSIPNSMTGAPIVFHTLVCGSDGKTYGSLCELMQTRCKLQLDTLEVDHDGPCDLKLGNNSRLVDCLKYVYDLNGLALEAGAHATLRTKPCEHNYDYICGLDDRTYVNDCVLCSRLAYSHQIQSGHTSVYIKHDGKCTPSVFG